MNYKHDFSILAIDTATQGCSVAIWSKDRILASETKTMDRGHSEVLMQMVLNTLKSAEKTF